MNYFATDKVKRRSLFVWISLSKMEPGMKFFKCNLFTTIFSISKFLLCTMTAKISKRSWSQWLQQARYKVQARIIGLPFLLQALMFQSYFWLDSMNPTSNFRAILVGRKTSYVTLPNIFPQCSNKINLVRWINFLSL